MNKGEINILIMNSRTINSDEEGVLPRSIPVLKPSFEASKVLENRFLSLDIGEAMELFTRVYGSGVETISEDHSRTGKEEGKFNQREKDSEGNQIETAESLSGSERATVVQTDPLQIPISESQTQNEDPYQMVQPESAPETSSMHESQIVEMLIRFQHDMQALRSALSEDVKQLQEEVNHIKSVVAELNVSAPVYETKNHDLKSEKKPWLIPPILKGVSFIIVYIGAVLLIITVVYSVFYFITPSATISANQDRINLPTSQGSIEKSLNPLMDMIRTPIKAMETFLDGLKKNAELKMIKPGIVLTDIPVTPVYIPTRTP